MRVSPKTMIIFGGIIWFAVGAVLLRTGLLLLATNSARSPEGLVLLMALALAVGFAKGRFILSRSARRAQARLQALGPAPLWRLYGRRDFMLIGSMMLLGMLMRAFHVPGDIRGFILTAVGAGLINGAVIAIRRGDRESLA
jgi:hypothetical protein